MGNPDCQRPGKQSETAESGLLVNFT
jgi:hypothetical protein